MESQLKETQQTEVKTPRNFSKAYIPFVLSAAIPVTMLFYLTFNWLIDWHIHKTLKNAKASQITEMTKAVNDARSINAEITEEQLKAAIIRIMLYKDGSIESYRGYCVKQPFFYPVITEPSLSDAVIIEQTKAAPVSVTNDPIKFEGFQRTVLASKPGIFSQLRDSLLDPIKMAFYVRRVMNGHIQFITVYFTFIAIGFWRVLYVRTRKQLELFHPKKSPAVVSSGEKPAFFIRKGNDNCRFTDRNDGLTDKVGSIPIITHGERHHDKHHNNYVEVTDKRFDDYTKGIDSRVDMLAKSKDYSPFHVIQSVCRRASLNGLTDEAVNALNDEIDMFHQRLERSASFFSYWIWLIPTIGFVGTIYGISGALQNAHLVLEADEALKSATTQGLTATLGIAFDTTLLALICSVPLMLLMKIQEWKTEFVVDTIHRIISDRVVDGLENAQSVNHRLTNYQKTVDQHMQKVEKHLTEYIAKILLKNQE